MRLDKLWEMTDVEPLLNTAMVEGFAGLRTVGYEYSGVKLEQGIGEHLVGSYIFPSKNRSIRIVLGAGAHVMLIAHVSNGTKSFELNAYLKFTGKTPPTKLGVINIREDIEPQLTSILSSIEGLLLEHANPIMLGESWIDVPLDWGGYK